MSLTTLLPLTPLLLALLACRRARPPVARLLEPGPDRRWSDRR